MKTKLTNEGWMVIEGDLISGWVEQTKRLDHDMFLIPLAVANMPEGGVVIDCGANIGSHTIGYSAKVGDHGTVIAIEAGKAAFECLFENSKKFQAKVLCINCAVCEIHGGRAIHTLDENNVGASTVNGETEENTDENEVRTITLDGFVQDADIKRVDFIKIDCEGYELKILQGAKSILKRFRPKMLIEMNSFRLRENGATYKDVYDFLLAQDYSWRICQPECKGGDIQYDVLCWPNLIITEKTMPNG